MSCIFRIMVVSVLCACSPESFDSPFVLTEHNSPDASGEDPTSDNMMDDLPRDMGTPITECVIECDRDRLVFVTSKDYGASELGSLEGADQICQDHARSSNLIGKYETHRRMRAWLSDSTRSAGSRFILGPGKYVRPDGQVVVEFGPLLLSGELERPISIDDLGSEVDVLVWTGTDPEGNLVSSKNSCDDWTSNSSFEGASFGLSDKSDVRWTQANLNGIIKLPCRYSNHLYCVEEW